MQCTVIWNSNSCSYFKNVRWWFSQYEVTLHFSLMMLQFQHEYRAAAIFLNFTCILSIPYFNPISQGYSRILTKDYFVLVVLSQYVLVLSLYRERESLASQILIYIFWKLSVKTKVNFDITSESLENLKHSRELAVFRRDTLGDQLSRWRSELVLSSWFLIFIIWIWWKIKPVLS